jgi:hypothetical protein
VAPVLTGKELLGNVKGCWYLMKCCVSFQSSVPPLCLRRKRHCVINQLQTTEIGKPVTVAPYDSTNLKKYTKPQTVCVISSYRRDVNEICAILGFYAA